MAIVKIQCENSAIKALRINKNFNEYPLCKEHTKRILNVAKRNFLPLESRELPLKMWKCSYSEEVETCPAVCGDN